MLSTLVFVWLITSPPNSLAVFKMTVGFPGTENKDLALLCSLHSLDIHIISRLPRNLAVMCVWLSRPVFSGYMSFLVELFPLGF